MGFISAKIILDFLLSLIFKHSEYICVLAWNNIAESESDIYSIEDHKFIE